MALVTLNPSLIAISGRVGGVVFKTYRDKIVATRVPRFDGYVPSAAQRERRDRMRAATAHAKRVYADPAAKAIYVAAAKELGRQPFRLAVSDFLSGRPRVTFAPTERRMRIAPRRPRTIARPNPGRHSLSQAGAHPRFPVFAFSQCLWNMDGRVSTDRETAPRSLWRPGVVCVRGAEGNYGRPRFSSRVSSPPSSTPAHSGHAFGAHFLQLY